MNIWKLGFEVDQYDNLISKPEMGISELQSFDGRSKKEHWIPRRWSGWNRRKCYR